MANELTPEQIDAIAREELAAETARAPSAPALSEMDIDRIAREELVRESGPSPSAAASLWAGLKHGVNRSLQAVKQAYIHGGIVAPEDPNPLTEEQKVAGETQLQQQLAAGRNAFEPYRLAHPWASGAGEFIGGIPVATAVSAPALAIGGLPAFTLGGGLTALSSPVESASGGPVGDVEFAKEKGKQAALGGLAGLATGGMLRYPGLPGIPINMAQVPARVLNYAQERAMRKPYAKEGARVASENSMDLSPAMVSGSRIGKVAEAAAAQSAFSADIALQAYNKLGDQAIARADAIKRQWSGKTDLAPEVIGQQIRDVTRDNVNKIQKLASDRFERGMNDLIVDAPQQFDYTNTKNALREYMDRYRYSNVPSEVEAFNKASRFYDSLDASNKSMYSMPDASAMDLLDNAYSRASARSKDTADRIIAQNGGFSKIAGNRDLLVKTYQNLEGIVTASPEKLIGPKPPEPVSMQRRVAQLGGIDQAYMPDVISESKLSPEIRKNMPAGVFKRTGGRSPDDMARALAEDGYLTPEEYNSLGGVQAMYNKLRDDISGSRKVYSQNDYGAAEDYLNWQNEAAKIQAAPIPDKLTVGGDNIPIKQAIAYRRSFGAAAKGSSTLFHDTPLTEDRALGMLLKNAIDKDFDAAANNAGGAFGEKFRAINREYALAKEKISSVKNTVLGKVLGNDIRDPTTGKITTDNIPVDKIADRIINLSPNDAKLAKSLLDEWDPSLSQDIKAYALQRAIEKGRDVPPSAGHSIQYSPGPTIKALQQTRSLDALLSKEEQATMRSFQSALQRWADRYGVNTSFTTPASEFTSWFKSLSAAGVAGAMFSPVAAAVGAAATGSWYLGTRQIAKMMLNPGDRTKLMKVMTAPRASEEITRLAAGLASKYAVSTPGPVNTEEGTK